MSVFCFVKGTKSQTHVIAAIHIYLKDSCHQEEHQQRASCSIYSVFIGTVTGKEILS